MRVASPGAFGRDLPAWSCSEFIWTCCAIWTDFIGDRGGGLQYIEPPNSQSIAVKEFWVRLCGIRGPDVWNLCEIAWRHFAWKLNDENLWKFSPKFRRIIHQPFEIDRPKFSRELHSGGLQPQNILRWSLHCNKGVQLPPKKLRRHLSKQRDAQCTCNVHHSPWCCGASTISRQAFSRHNSRQGHKQQRLPSPDPSQCKRRKYHSICNIPQLIRPE